MASKRLKDQMGRELDFPSAPERIISLVPSQTELLYSLGLEEKVIGITRFCVHPESWFRNKTRVGGTKDPNLEKIRALKPDLIIGNKEENEQESMEELMKEFPVWMSDIRNLDDALEMIGNVGELTQTQQRASELIKGIKTEFARLPIPGKQKRTAYFIWKNPYMAASTDTFISRMMDLCGFRNVFEGKRYPSITAKDLQEADPECILLSSEPYPFGPKHLEEFKAICPAAEIKIVDGEYFSWYGSRLLKAPAYFRSLIAE